MGSAGGEDGTKRDGGEWMEVGKLRIAAWLSLE